MKKRLVILAAAVSLVGANSKAQDAAPLKLVQAYKMPEDVKGHFDHLTIDLKEHRLFTTPEDYHSVLVFDTENGKLIHKIDGIGKPHAVLYRPDLKRLYVTDGDAGEVKIFDSESYKPISSVKLLEDTDSIGYDPATKYLYVDNGGGGAHETYSMLSVIDTTAAKKLADMKIDGDTLEAMALERGSPRMFVNNRAKNEIAVVDRGKRELITGWPVTKGKVNVAMALDQAHNRLFIGCRSGVIVVLDTKDGKEITALPITKGVDDLVYDSGSKRIYAAADGSADVYEEVTPDNYKHLGTVTTGPLGKTALLVPAIKRYFVSVPQHGATPAEVLVFEVL